MSDPIYNYLDPELDLTRVNTDYTLLLQVYATSFSYAVLYDSKLLAWAEDCDLSLMDDPGEHELLTFEYKNVVTGLSSTGFTLIPDLLYDENKLADFARYLDVKPTEKILAQPLDIENHIIFKVDETVADTAEIYGLKKAIFIHKGWIAVIARSEPTKHDLYLDIHKEQVSILYFIEGKVRFYNSFIFHNPDELAYYCAFVAQELQLQPRQLNLIVSGHFSVGDPNGTRLAVFFNGVEENHLGVFTVPGRILPHQILALTALTLCVSLAVV